MILGDFVADISFSSPQAPVRLPTIARVRLSGGRRGAGRLGRQIIESVVTTVCRSELA
jgi:hypothetical protein